MYRPCNVPECDHMTLTPEDPAKLEGPEVGALCIYQDPNFPRWDGLVVKVLKRSYVWSPEVHMAMNEHGNRLYDVSVIQFGEPDECCDDSLYGSFVGRKTMFVDDTKLIPLGVGLRVKLIDQEED